MSSLSRKMARKQGRQQASGLLEELTPNLQRVQASLQGIQHIGESLSAVREGLTGDLQAIHQRLDATNHAVETLQALVGLLVEELGNRSTVEEKEALLERTRKIQER